MLDDAELFLQLCQKQKILVEPEIVEAIKTSCSTGELQLAHTSIIASLCKIIAQVLFSSSVIKVVNLSDCMLLSKGCSCILNALSQGSSVCTLYLKGNNINGLLVEQLGDMLLHNNTLKIMHIEWNNLGSEVNSFVKFCSGLAKNNSLEELDLQYNQISTNCADSIAKVLQYNKSLKKLNLAWNSIGTNGGKVILKAMKQNRTLILFNLKGNCISNEIQSAINIQAMENQKRRILHETPTFIKENVYQDVISNEINDRVIQLKSRIRKKKKQKEKSKLPIIKLISSPLGNCRNNYNDPLNLQVMSMHASKKTDSVNFSTVEIDEKIIDLNGILQEQSRTIDLLKMELELKNTDFKSIHIENEKLKIEMEQVKEENIKIFEEKTKNLENFKKIQSKIESNLKESCRDLEEANENNVKLRQEIDVKNRTYEKELKKTSVEIQSLKEKLLSTIQSYEDIVSENKIEIHRVKRELHEKENQYKIEVGTLKESLKESTEALEKCQEHLQKLRNELCDSMETQAELKIKAEESERFASRTSKIEDSLRKSKDERGRLEEKLQESRKSIALLQKSIIKLQEDSIEPQKRYEALKIELRLEKEKSLNLKSEIQDQTTRIREQNEQVQKMLSQINNLYTQLNDTQNNHAEAIRVKDTEIEKLKNIITQKTSELDNFKSEQVQRTHQFQAAVSKYIGSVI